MNNYNGQARIIEVVRHEGTERERQWLKERRKNENRSVLFIEILRYGNDKTAFTNGCFSCHNSV